MWRIIASLLVPLHVVAVVFVIVGICHVARDCHSSWYQDGGVFYEDSGREVVIFPKPIRIGNTLLAWDGPSWMAMGFVLTTGLVTWDRRARCIEV